MFIPNENTPPILFSVIRYSIIEMLSIEYFTFVDCGRIKIKKLNCIIHFNCLRTVQCYVVKIDFDGYDVMCS